MGSESKNNSGKMISVEEVAYNLVKFKLYETRSMFYLVGRDKSKKFWRVLKIDRSEPSDLVIVEDPTIYVYRECCSLLRRIHEGNKHIGGLKVVTTCYGIVGFIKFLGPYYMLLITERRKVGIICGHDIYAVSKSKLIAIPHSTVPSNFDNSKKENRYKKLLCTLDITKDFFFSYSYRLMHSLQKNQYDHDNNIIPYENMFVWNAFLTREIRSRLWNTLWTVPLVHGFFNQVELTKADRTFYVTLIARRSRHFAGTRYLKRGINEKGHAANDVETEQIVFEEVAGGNMLEMSSVVQIRGSIPLFWSQETSRIHIKPNIILSNEDHSYEATQRHFQDLVDRYGNRIIILNLIKTKEKKPRESILHAEFVKAVCTINRNLGDENRLKFRTVDLTKLFRERGAKVLTLLNKVTGNALDQTGLFYCQVPSSKNPERSARLSYVPNKLANANNIREHLQPKSVRFQSGVLRTNCIDCLDRTNVAQYAFGLVALGYQLHAIGINPTPNIDLKDVLAGSLMVLYEEMGDILALQYGGSAAHNKIFAACRGNWKAATQSQEFIRTVQRYLNNVYLDSEKQDSMNLFLGKFLPKVDKPALWELDSNDHYNIGRLTPPGSHIYSRSFLRRSLSDGIIYYENSSPTTTDIGDSSTCHHHLSDDKEDHSGLSDSTPEITTCVTDITDSRLTPSMPAGQLFTSKLETEYRRGHCSCYNEHGDEFNCSDVINIDRVSSSATSCEEDPYDRSSLVNSPVFGSFYGNQRAVSPIPNKFPDSFAKWVEFGTTFS